jgi:hypothetical protein
MLCDYDSWKLSSPPQWDKETDLLTCEDCNEPIDPEEYGLTINEMNPICFACSEA